MRLQVAGYDAIGKTPVFSPGFDEGDEDIRRSDAYFTKLCNDAFVEFALGVYGTAREELDYNERKVLGAAWWNEEAVRRQLKVPQLTVCIGNLERLDLCFVYGLKHVLNLSGCSFTTDFDAAKWHVRYSL
nr:hypothetical protein [Burkholderia cepacia]